MTWPARSTGGRRSPDPVRHERSGAWTVDRAVRALATGCAEHGRPLPPVGAIELGAETVSLRLTTPDETPPQGWSVEDHGRTWQSALRRLEHSVVDLSLADAFPLLVSIGRRETGERLLLNLARSGGLVGIEGDLTLARGLARSWSRRLTRSPWAARTPVVRVGFPPERDFAGWAVGRLVEAEPVLAEAVPAEASGGVVLFADPPEGRDRHLVDQLRAEPLRRWTVVAVGADDATWRFTVHEDGTVDTGLIADPVLLCA